MKKKRALISVSDKTGIVELATSLKILGFELLSTGGTKVYLEQAGIETRSVTEITGFPEMMAGRVKTLHPKIHGALLAREKDQAELDIHKITPIDLVVVNLYPFKETIQQIGSQCSEEVIEQIDIGGPSMLRSAAKNHERVTVVVDHNDYSKILQELTEFKEVSLLTRRQLAAKAFRHTAYYDTLIADYLTKIENEKFPEKLSLGYDRHATLRYGENSHQEATVYASALLPDYSLLNATQYQGKELSFNNYRDGDSALRLLQEFSQPTAVAVKHMNPCGVGTSSTIEVAFENCLKSDPVSIFGGIVAFNRTISLDLAKELTTLFLEIIIAPDFTEEAIIWLSSKKNLRLLSLPMTTKCKTTALEVTSILGGVLVQEIDDAKECVEDWLVVTQRKPTSEEINALKFAWLTVKHVKSNAIVIANDKQTLGIGAGQMNRVGSVELALKQAEGRLESAVLASDAFFPMADSLEKIAQAGIRAVIQPGGSIRDEDSIKVADAADITMIFTQKRHFKH